MEPYGAVQFGTIGMEYRPDRPAVGSNWNMREGRAGRHADA